MLRPDRAALTRLTMSIVHEIFFTRGHTNESGRMSKPIGPVTISRLAKPYEIRRVFWKVS